MVGRSLVFSMTKHDESEGGYLIEILNENHSFRNSGDLPGYGTRLGSKLTRKTKDPQLGLGCVCRDAVVPCFRPRGAVIAVDGHS